MTGENAHEERGYQESRTWELSSSEAFVKKMLVAQPPTDLPGAERFYLGWCDVRIGLDADVMCLAPCNGASG